METVATIPEEELRKHNSPGAVWLAIDGDVYDVTGFLDRHPGGRAALLSYAGGDASAAFWTHHSAALLRRHGAKFRVGRLAGAAHGGGRAGRGGGGRAAGAVDSPFPHSQFEGSGLEAARFIWADLAALTAARCPGAPFQLKSNLSTLEEQDWLHVHGNERYAKEMEQRRILLTEHATHVCTSAAAAAAAAATDPKGFKRADQDVVAAELEVLEMVLEWLGTHHPDRFVVSADEVTTLTPSYEHTFKRAEFTEEPLRLAGLLVQEDLVLMREEAVAEGGVKKFGRDQLDLQREDHPTGLRHVLVSGVACFSTNVVKRHMLPMSGIHHPAVPGFRSHLQCSMNRFMAQLTAEGHWRHNYMFQDFDSTVLLDHPWAKYVCQEELSVRTHHQHADRAKRFSAAAGDGFFRDVQSASDVGRHIRLRCEYQTLRRLPRNSSFIAFTVKSYVDPLHQLAKEPAAALALSATIRQRPKGIFYYQSLGLAQAQRAVLEYLDGLVAAGGLRPWRGFVPEPWARGAEDDGTFAFNLDLEVQRQRSLQMTRCGLVGLAAVSVVLAVVLTLTTGLRQRRALAATC